MNDKVQRLINAATRMIVGIDHKSTPECNWYQGIEFDAADEAHAAIDDLNLNGVKATDEIFFVYENADSTEGRGPMVIVPDSGFFTTEDEAWKFANTLCGVMGRRHDWRKEKYGDIRVERFVRHNGSCHKKMNYVKDRIAELEKELLELRTSCTKGGV